LSKQLCKAQKIVRAKKFAVPKPAKCGKIKADIVPDLLIWHFTAWRAGPFFVFGLVKKLKEWNYGH